MKVAFGFKAHSGWAAMVVIGTPNHSIEVLERRRLDLAHKQGERQPYHAAEQLAPKEARRVVERGVRAAHDNAKRQMTAAVERAESKGYRVAGCGVLVGTAMPAWSIDEILAVHFRMHKAEGVLFREALAQAAITCNLRVERIPEKGLIEVASKVLRRHPSELVNEIARLGKRAGPPWGKDQKEAGLAAMIALHIGSAA